MTRMPAARQDLVDSPDQVASKRYDQMAQGTIGVEIQSVAQTGMPATRNHLVGLMEERGGAAVLGNAGEPSYRDIQVAFPQLTKSLRVLDGLNC